MSLPTKNPANYCSICGSWWPLAGDCDWCSPGQRPRVTKAEAAVDLWTDRFILAAISFAGLYVCVHVLVWLVKTIGRGFA